MSLVERAFFFVLLRHVAVNKSRDDGETKSSAHCGMGVLVRSRRRIIAFQPLFLKPVSQKASLNLPANMLTLSPTLSISRRVSFRHLPKPNRRSIRRSVRSTLKIELWVGRVRVRLLHQSVEFADDFRVLVGQIDRLADVVGQVVQFDWTRVFLFHVVSHGLPVS